MVVVIIGWAFLNVQPANSLQFVLSGTELWSAGAHCHRVRRSKESLGKHPEKVAEPVETKETKPPAGRWTKVLCRNRDYTNKIIDTAIPEEYN